MTKIKLLPSGIMVFLSISMMRIQECHGTRKKNKRVVSDLLRLRCNYSKPFPFKLCIYSVVHAEVNALMFRNCLCLEGCTLYTTLFPCLDCAKTIIRSGIKELYYLADPVEFESDKNGEREWDDQEMDEEWKKLQKEKPEKTTFVASRHLLQEYKYKSNLKGNNDPCCKRYRPSKIIKVELQRQE